MADTVRVGNVSSIDYEHGMIEVTYPDLDDCVTDAFPVFSFTDEYKMPGIGDEVLVLHLSNGESAGIVMGRYWNEDNVPKVSGKNVFRKELGRDPGEAYLQYMDGSISMMDQDGELSVRIILDKFREIDNRLEALENRCDAIENRLDIIDSRLDSHERRIEALERRS